MRKTITFLLLALALLLGQAAFADPIIFTADCGAACANQSWIISFNSTGTNQYNVTYQAVIQQTMAGSFLGVIDFGGAQFSQFSLNSVTDTFNNIVTPISGWVAFKGPAANSGADCGNKNTNRVCAQGPFGNLPVIVGNTYTWVFDVSTNAPVTATFIPFKAIFVNSDGNFAGVQVSETASIPPPPSVPEPASLALFGSGLLGAIGILRRKLA